MLSRKLSQGACDLRTPLLFWGFQSLRYHPGFPAGLRPKKHPKNSLILVPANKRGTARVQILSDLTVPNMEACTMDPHFNEYQAAIAGMMECYGKPSTNSSFEPEPSVSIKTERFDCSEKTERSSVRKLFLDSALKRLTTVH